MKTMAYGIALLALVAGSGCGASSFRGAGFLPPIFRSSLGAPPPLVARGAARGVRPVHPAGAPGPADLVERSLRERGLRFGTDGSPESLYAYVKFSHDLVPPASARPGDVAFFDFAGQGCGDHVGIIEAVDGGGRMTFRESRAGLVRRSFVHPARPRERRDAEGRVLNTFLRPRRMDDPAEARYFAGEMLCAVGRVSAR